MIWRRGVVLGSILSVALMSIGCSDRGSGKGENADPKETTQAKPGGDRPVSTGKTSASSTRLEAFFRVV
jgi:hypothetical protein